MIQNITKSQFSFQNKAKLPKWFGERPGKKGLDPESPDDDGEGAVADIGVEEDEDEEVD